jgi:6,7-dimethyl-8-ribityllumazine synthase
MSQAVDGSLEGQGAKVALVLSRFNDFVTSKLLHGAEDCLERHGCKNRSVYRVPGSWEIPPVVGRLVAGGQFDAVIALGALIRGETPHFDVLAAAVTHSLARISREAPIPVIYGILTTDTVEQAIDRAGAKAGNKGWHAALSAVEMINLYRRMA